MKVGFSRIALAIMLMGGLALFSGCGAKGRMARDAAKPKAPSPQAKEHEHQGEGPHHGILVEWGEDQYHAEVVFNHADKEVVVYLLDGEAKAAPTLEPAKISNITVNINNVTPPFAIELAYDSKKSNAKGMAFEGRDDRLAKATTIQGSVSGKVAGTPFTGDFAGAGHQEKESPEGGLTRVVGDNERNLYLTPGGLYTEADIRANGETVPSVKFRDIIWAHEEDLKPGDKICPITKNRAEDKCSWIIGGKTYEFCCPPCLDKFMLWAKKNPEKVKNPEDYVKK